MKGLTHFTIGVAAASCFPRAVEAGSEGNPLYFILGGVFGLLPDVIDFKFVRFFAKHEITVQPDPNSPDPQVIADGIAHAVNRAHESGRPVGIKLGTIRMGADLWRRYTVRFDVSGRRVVVEYGPAVSTGQNPVPDTAPPPRKAAASADLACALQLDYTAANTIDIFDGPIFRMMPVAGGKVCPRFIPWHREWSHSIVTGAVVAVAAAVIGGWTAAGVVLCAWLAHVLADQLGFMGSNLFFPFRTRRTDGLKWMHSGNSTPNFAAVWLSCLVIFWNLYRAAYGDAAGLTFIRLMFYGAAVPTAAVAAARGIRKLLVSAAARQRS